MSDTPITPEEQPVHDADSSVSDEAVVDPIPEHVNLDCAKAPLSSKWSIKLFLITFLVIAFGAYGLYDATIAYPKRGERYADWAKWQYLEAAKAAGTEEFGIFQRQSSVEDPIAEFERLDDSETRQRNLADAQNQSSTNTLRATMRNTRYDWLKGLKVIGKLSPEHTIISSPQDELDALSEKWTSSTSNPKPLKSYDIPSQWGIMGVCWIIGGVMLLNIFKVLMQKYSWDASTKTITVPGDIQISPAHLVEVDKRKWDKFIVFLVLNDSHSSHGGKEIKVDTYQHALVEDWILEMERSMQDSSSGSEQPS